MLITHPSVMLKNIRWMEALLDACNFLSRLFPKVFCSVTLTWAIYALLDICYVNIYIGLKRPLLSTILSIGGFMLYLSCIYTYFMIVYVGGGSPSDFEEMKIRNIDLLRSKDNVTIDSNGSDAPIREREQEEEEEEENLLSEEYQDEPPVSYVEFHVTKPGVSPYRYCIKCKVWKPDRCHHCSTCNKCILRMDHHCPWFACCIGYYNQKFFIQHLLYICGFSTYCCIISSIILYRFFNNQEYEHDYLTLKLVFLFILSIVFMITITIFGFFLIYLVLKNRTTIEFQDERWWGDKQQYKFDSGNNKKYNIFDLGTLNNWKAVMGPNIWYWILPISFTKKDITSKVNGINFIVNEETYDEFIQNIRIQEQLNKQLADYRESLRRERLA